MPGKHTGCTTSDWHLSYSSCGDFQLKLETLHSCHCCILAAVNDPPTLNRGNATVTVTEDFGAYSAAWATNISAGPGESEPLAFAINCSSANLLLFATPPAMDVDGRLGFTPGPNMFGNATCTV
jgi:hypothetical protein